MSFTSISDDPPFMSVTWMNPSRPEVVSGVIVAWGRVWTIFAARCAALTSLPVARPGWMETPSTRITARSAENVS